MNPQTTGIGIKIDRKINKKYDCKDCTYKKYGNEIKIREFVNAGRDGTEAKKIIGKTVSLEDLRKMCKEIPEQENVVDMNLNPYMAEKIMKTAKISYNKIQELKKQKEMMEQNKQEKDQEKDKKGDVNE